MDKNLLDTPYYIINWNEEGQLTRIYDKKTEREILREGQKGNVLEIYEDKPVNYDAWDIDIFYIQKMETIKMSKAPQMVESGNLRAVIRFCYQYHRSVIIQDMIVYRDHAGLISKPMWTGKKSIAC